MAAFRSGEVTVLVATDIAARGIDVDNVTHVVNYELPNVPESYVHRIGRTARAGKSGIALSLCTQDERSLLGDIEKLIGYRIVMKSVRNEAANDAKAIQSDAPKGERPVVQAQPLRPAASKKRNRRRRGGNAGHDDQMRRADARPAKQRRRRKPDSARSGLARVLAHAGGE